MTPESKQGHKSTSCTVSNTLTGQTHACT